MCIAKLKQKHSDRQLFFITLFTFIIKQTSFRLTCCWKWHNCILFLYKSNYWKIIERRTLFNCSLNFDDVFSDSNCFSAEKYSTLKLQGKIQLNYLILDVSKRIWVTLLWNEYLLLNYWVTLLNHIKFCKYMISSNCMKSFCSRISSDFID